ncbi:family 10 glycosylhydrolase [uncultured Proteiniphilum sp.]|uniref:family 10 glycosylhydrolase n=1 Tax=uncultured Proteiniphilum sp. TaxID=497637 RepID=UPI0026025EE4|nr:family 10 glycosylhydrolase [uncultured Proteiniphilum sp.]
MLASISGTIKKRLYCQKIIILSIIQIVLVSILFPGCNGILNKTTPGPQFHVRALWVDPPGFKDRETVDNLIEKCQLAGINTLLPDIMLRDEVWFKSKNFIGKVHADEEYDPLAYLIEKAHEAGIKVQPWSCTYYSIPKHPDWISKPFVDNNYDHVYLSAAHPDVNPYLLSVLEELLEYDIDGIHLDYSRYWNAAFDYSEAARNRFKASYNFDPQDFFDHPERIVPPAEDRYPVRMLCPDASTPYVATLGTIERNLNRTGVGYAYISEKPANIDALRVPGLLIISYYNHIPDEMSKALDRYVKRGGDIIWISPDNSLFEKNLLGALTGVKGARGFKTERIRLQVSDDLFGKSIDTLRVKIGGSSLVTEKADIIARLDTDEPVVTINQKEKGKVVVIGFQLMHSDSPQVMEYFKDVITGLRTQAGVTGPDPMGEKRKQWIEWRASYLKELFREVSKMVKKKDPNLPVTSASGVGPQQYHGIYRDSRELLSENIVDYIFPMNYTDKLDDLKDILDEQVLYTPEGMSERIYPGLKLYTRKNNTTVPMDAEIVGQQLEMVKQYGYRGFCLFAYSYFSDEMVEVIERYSH